MMFAPARNLLDHHRDELRASGLTDETIAAAEIYSEASYNDLAAMVGWKQIPKRAAPAIVFPHPKPDGSFNGYCTIKPAVPVKMGDRECKYLAPRGQAPRPYFPPGTIKVLNDTSAELLITEGQKKALAADQAGFPCIGLLGVWNFAPGDEGTLLPELNAIRWTGRQVRITFDSDAAEKVLIREAEKRLAAFLKSRGAHVLVVRLPGGPEQPDGSRAKVGLDDFLLANSIGALRKLLDAGDEPGDVDPITMRPPAKEMDPGMVAESFLGTGKLDGVYKLVFSGGTFYLWQGGRYSEVQPSEVRAHVMRHIRDAFRGAGTNHVANVLEHVKAVALLPSDTRPPTWLAEPPLLNGSPFPATDVLVARNGLIHLPSLTAGRDYFHPPTPRFFTNAALDYAFRADAPTPTLWLNFLHQLWPDDNASIEALQEWFGLSLTHDTSFQKILLLVGPKRSGKGTIARVQRLMVGKLNVAAPTLATFGGNFGLWGLVGKLLAIVGDARLSGRADQAPIVERLLSISGEDALDVDRKFLEPLLGYTFPTRLMLLTNELPRLSDSSGALPGRLILLQLTRSFYGQEDRQLTDKLAAELPGILLWAIEGWKRLTARGHFVQPESVADVMRDMEDLASPVGAFVRERCVVDSAQWIDTGILYEAWKSWCAEKGAKPTNDAVFGRDLAAAVPSAKRKQRREKGDHEVRFRVYEGIGLVTG